MKGHRSAWAKALVPSATLAIGVMGMILPAVAQTADATDPTGTSFGAYTTGSGFKVADTDRVGNTSHIKQRQDQVNKVLVYFQGWLMSQRFRYLLYVSTQNVSQEALTEALVGGLMTYTFTPDVTFGFGMDGLPGVRSTERSFPYWLGGDERLIADEYFRPSYTTGLFARGEIVKKLQYNVMWGDNLSQLGVDAAQLADDMKMFSGALIWMPTTGEFGAPSSFGDFEGHDRVATRFGVHYTYRDENPQEQPGTEARDNTRLRISDSNIVFTPGVFGPGIAVTNVVDQPLSFNAGIKYHGFAVEAEYYWRRLDNFRGTAINTLPFNHLIDTGFQAQASAMVLPKQLQVYGSGSKVFGGYRHPYDVRTGVNAFPWKNQVIRWNTEFIYVRRSPVAALSLPPTVGGNGPVFVSNLQANF